MVTNKLEELKAARAKLAQLEAEVAAAQQKELAALPARYGFPDTNSFIAAVQAAGGKRRGRKARASGGAGGGKKRRTRAVITDETRAEVKKLVAAGKTGAQISKELGISIPSVQNIKKALGLVKKK